MVQVLVPTPRVLPSPHGGKNEAKLGNCVLPSMGLGKEKELAFSEFHVPQAFNAHLLISKKGLSYYSCFLGRKQRG